MSGYTTTPRYLLKKPTPGADDDAWGGHLNSNADVIDNMAPLDSPVFTGNPQAPTPTAGDADTSIATTAFVQNAVGAVPGGATIAPTPPALNPGALWWDSTGGQLYVRYNDGNSTQWTAASSLQGQAGVATTSYVDNAVSGAQRNVGRNLIHNGLFTVAQRGAGPFNTNGYTLDRWNLIATLDTCSFQRDALAPGGMPLDEHAAYQFNCYAAGNAAAGSSTVLIQSIEDVRRLSGKTVIVSFYAAAGVAGAKFGVSIDQHFGSGGSPSAQVNGVGQSVTLTGGWVRYSMTFIVPSIVGKTLGTNNDHRSVLFFWFSAGSTAASRSGGVPVQTGSTYLWGVQLEIAAPGQTAPSPLEKMDAQQTLAVCQRFYQTGLAYCLGYVSGAGGFFGTTISLPVTMRGTAAPAIAFTGTTYSNASGIATSSVGVSQFGVYATGTAIGGVNFTSGFTASADL